MTAIATMYKCPHCGNTDEQRIEDNGCDPRDEEFTLLCLAPVEDGEESFDEYVLQEHPDMRRLCGMQWEPNGEAY
jgi:hypothetical protein